MAKMKVSGKVSKAKKKLEVGLGELERAVKAETEGLTDPQEAKNREAEIRDMFFTARKKTKGFQTGILMGLFGDEVGQALANVFAKEDPSKVKSSQQFFKKYKEKPKKEKLDQRQLKNISNLVGKTARSRMPIAPEETSAKSSQVSLKKGYYFDERIGAMGGIRNVRTGQFASEEQATKRKERSDRLTKAIGADEEPLVLLRERFDVLVKSVGKDNSGKTIHEKLDELIDQVESGGGSGFGLGDLLGLGGGRGGRGGRGGKPRTKPKGRFARATTATRKFFGGQQGRDAKGRFTKGGGGFGAGKLLAGGVGAAAGGYLAYKAVDAFRDKDLTSYDPEALKQEAIAAREAGDTEYTEALKTQIAMQKKDVALQAGATVASVAGAGVGGYVGVKAAQKIGQTAPAKKVTAAVAKKAAPIAKAVKNKTWDLFIKFLKARAPKLAAKVGTRLAAAGAMATIPVAGWVGAAISLGFAASTAYDLYQLWKEFSALSDAEKETAASGKPSKEVNNWAYSVYIGKAKIEDVPDTYKEQVEEILKKPPANWKKPGATETAGAGKPAAITGKPQTLAGAAATGAAMGETTAKQSMGAPPAPPTTKPSTSTPSVTPAPPTSSATPASAVATVKETTKAAAGGANVNAFSGPVPNLDKVTTKKSGVDTAGLDKGFSDRMARMAAAFESVTGKKLLITSAYRDDQKQLELWNAKYAEMKAKNPQASESELMAMTRKWVALPVSLGGKPSRHVQGIATDINSKGATGIEAINGMTFNGQKVTTDSFLATFGLQRPLKHEPWHIQPLGDAPTPDNPDPTAKAPLVADASGKAVNLESGKSEQIKTNSTTAAKATTPTPIGGGGGAPTAPKDQAMTAKAATGGGGATTAPKDQAMTAKAATGGAAATATPAVGGASVTPAGGGAAAVPSIPVASASGGGATAITTANIGTANIKTLNAPQITPKQDGLGSAATQQSTQYASNQIAMQATPPPVVVNNSSGGSQQPITPPKQNMPKASARSNDNSFNRALARDFSHPSAFTSVGLV